MGISIHYKGQMDRGKVEALCDELRDIAEVLDWPYTDIDDRNVDVRGIILAPKSGMEMVPFLFDAEGRIQSVAALLCGVDPDAFACASVKTQFAGSGEHMWLVGLLHYIQRKYIPELEVTDEGAFWETGDKEELERRFDYLGRMIDKFREDIEQALMDQVIDQKDPDALADLVEQLVKKFASRNTKK